MKEMICIEVELKEFLKANKTEDVVIVRRNGKWVCDTMRNLLKDTNKKIEELKDIVESFKLDNIQMKIEKNQWSLESEKIKQALVFYGFKMFEEDK